MRVNGALQSFRKGKDVVDVSMTVIKQPLGIGIWVRLGIPGYAQAPLALPLRTGNTFLKPPTGNGPPLCSPAKSCRQEPVSLPVRARSVAAFLLCVGAQ